MLAVTHTLFTVSVNCEIHLIVVQRGIVVQMGHLFSVKTNMSPEGINPELCGWSLRMVLLQGISVFSGKFCFSSLCRQGCWPCLHAPYVESTLLGVVCSFRGSRSYRTHPSNLLEIAGQNQGKVNKSTNHRNPGITNDSCTCPRATRDARVTGTR